MLAHVVDDFCDIPGDLHRLCHFVSAECNALSAECIEVLVCRKGNIFSFVGLVERCECRVKAG